MEIGRDSPFLSDIFLGYAGLSSPHSLSYGKKTAELVQSNVTPSVILRSFLKFAIVPLGYAGLSWSQLPALSSLAVIPTI